MVYIGDNASDMMGSDLITHLEERILHVLPMIEELGV